MTLSSKNIEMQINLDNFLSECSNALDVIEMISTRISGTGALKCKAKTALSAYINDVILGVMIPVTRMAMSYLSTEVSCYVFEMYDYDNDEHAVIQEDFLNALNEKLNSLGTDVLDILGCCKTVAGNVSDIMALDLKSADNMGDAYAGLSEMVLKTRDDIGGYLETFQTRAGDLYNVMSAFYTTVSGYSMGSVDMTAYAGEYHNNTSLEDLQPKLIEYVKSIGYTQDELEHVSELKNDVITAYIREMDGEQKLLRIGFLVVGAVSLMCPFAMGFTLPTTIASLSISSIAIVYNADQVYQGVQLMDAAETRDTDAEIDTLVHFDNEYMQQAYELVGEFATSYTCSLVIASISPGAGNGNVSFKSVMTDVRDDYIGGLMSEGIELATGQSNFLIDQMTGLFVGKLGGSAFGDMPGYVPSQSVDVRQSVDVPNGSRAVVNAVDDINVNRVIPDVEVSGVDLPNSVMEIPDGVQTSGTCNIAGAVEAVNTGKVPEVELPNGKVDVKTGVEGGRNTTTTIDYSYKFDRELANFNDGYEIRTTVDKDSILVQYSSDAPDASLCYWTTVDEANGITTLSGYMDKLALSKDWGNRNTVKVARIPAGTEVKYAVGTAREQLLLADPRPGGGVQYLFNQFDTDWITEIRSFSN